MNKVRFTLQIVLIFLGFVTLCLPAQAASVADLSAEGRLQVRSWLEPAEDIVPGQQIKLILEIATDSWFTGGTRIRIPEVPGLVILQTDNFASNSSEQRNGQTWVVQRWSLEVYPQRDGNFTLPPVTAQIKVNDGTGATVEGAITGPALRFSSTRPESLARVEHWVAAPGFTVSQSFDQALEGLQVGDAFEREIVFKANEVMAMMLPTFAEDTISGLTAYPDPPELDNASNRGSIVATRRQRLTYIVEAEGEYQLPAQDYFWWDTRTGELQLLSLPTVVILAGLSPPETGGDKPPAKISPRTLIISICAIALLAALIGFVRKLPLNAAFARISAGYRFLREWWRKLRSPALSTKLNPGNSAGG